MPRHIVAVSPGEVPWNDAERAIMQANNPKDMMEDYAFMEKVERYEKQGRDDVPEFMIHISIIDSCKKYGVKYSARERPGMIHCYAMLPYFRESKEDFEEITAILAK